MGFMHFLLKLGGAVEYGTKVEDEGHCRSLFFWKLLKHSINLILVCRLLWQTAMLVLLSDIKRELVIFIQLLFLTGSRMSFINSGEKCRSALKKISHLTTVLSPVKLGIGLKVALAADLTVIMVVVPFASSFGIGHGTFCDPVPSLMPFCEALHKVDIGLSTLCSLVTSFSQLGFGAFASRYIEVFYLAVVERSRLATTLDEALAVCRLHSATALAMDEAADAISATLFLEVLVTMASSSSIAHSVLSGGLSTRQSACAAAAVLLGLFGLLLIMAPAAAANESANSARESIAALPARFPFRHSQLMQLAAGLRARPHFRLWRLYRIDWALIVSSIGSFVTYGVLFATLGSVNKAANAEREKSM